MNCKKKGKNNTSPIDTDNIHDSHIELTSRNAVLASMAPPDE
jgi:hypothetical protein